MAAPTIVIGTDFSEGSRRAVQAVALLAHGTPTRVLLVHAFPSGKTGLAGAPLRQVKASIAAAEAVEVRELTEIAERLRQGGLEVETTAVPGKPTATLLAQAKKRKAGLIAVGTSGRRGIGGRFLGSISQAVLRDSPVPVLVTPARHRQGRRRAGPVLAAVDLGPGSKAVLQAAAGLAGDLGVALHVLHAMPIPAVAGAGPDPALAFTPEVLAADEAEAARRLTTLVEAVRDRVKVRTSVSLGDPATHVLAQAVHVGAAAIVVGRRKAGRRLGSVSATVVQAADRPVLVVPAGFGERAARRGAASTR